MKKNRKKYYKISLKNAEKYGDLVYKAVKEQLNFQIVNGVEASIDTINYFLEKKDVDGAQISLEQLKRQVKILWEMIKKGAK